MDEITYTLPHLNGAVFIVWEWIIDFILFSKGIDV